MTIETKRTERGWAGHFICSDRCKFRRNTLLEHGDTRIVVSTVGQMIDLFLRGKSGFGEVGLDRHFETMAFHAKHDGRYWDADVRKQIDFGLPWSIETLDADDLANDMHESIVAEISRRLESGDTFPVDDD